MTKKSGIAFFIVVLCCLLVGCGNDAQDFTFSANGSAGPQEANGGGAGGPLDPTPGSGDTLRQIPARLTLPSGMSLDLTGFTTMAQLISSGVNADGTTSVALGEEGGRVLAIAFTANEDPFLAAFITEQDTEISLDSTVKASLFVGMGTSLLPVEIRDSFWTGVENFPGYTALVADAETLFRNDPLFFQSTAYRDLIRSYISSLLGGGISARLITDGTVKSGLQVSEVEGDAVMLVQNFRRRTHAFVYKLGFKDTADVVHPLIMESEFQNGSSLLTDRQLLVSAASGFSSTIGTIQAGAGGKGLEFFAKESGPIDLSLGPQEKKVDYSIRVVGPSATPGALTAAEEARLRELEIETLALDYFMPVLLKILNQDKDQVGKLTALQSAGEGFLNVFKAVLTATPGAQESLEKGDYLQALQDIVDGMIDGGLEEFYQPLMKAGIDLINISSEGAGRKVSPAEAQRILGSVKNFAKFLEGLDILLQAADWTRISADIVESRMVEDFRVSVTRNMVTLSPPAAIVIRGTTKSVKAIIQDGAATLGDGEAFVYKWSTTGNYGSLRDNVGQTGTSFESSRDTVDYVADAGTIPDDAEDEITCEVFIRGPGPDVPVGETTDPAKFRVRSRGFEILPQNPLAQGGTNVPLLLKLTDGSNPLDSEIYDYQFVWETPGLFGRFNGTLTNFSSTTSNQAIYECLETEDEGEETFSVTVYSKFKGEDGPFEFDDRLEGTIDVENDPNKKIVYVPYDYLITRQDVGPIINVQVQGIYQIAPIPGGLVYNMVSIPATVGGLVVSREYDARITPPTDGFYRIPLGVSAISTGSEEDVQEFLATQIAIQESLVGFARVVIELDPNR